MVEKDIAPELIEKVNKEFEENLSKDKRASNLQKKLSEGRADYADAYDYAETIGTARAKAFGSEISSDVLPDGKMYYNIASRLMGDSLLTDHKLVTDYAAAVQKAYNSKLGIHLKEQRADLDEDRIKGFADRLSSEENFDDAAWLLNEPVVTHARSVVDDTIKKNAEFQHKAGIKATINRKAAARCCDWCTDLEGDYTYPGVPREVFQRHDHCKCALDYNGKRLTAYESKNGAHSFRDPGEKERIEARRWKSDTKTKNRLDINKNSGKIKKERITKAQVFSKEGAFNSEADPMADVFGPGIVSNPNEIALFRKECERLGVAILERENESLSYQPNPKIGLPGQITVSTKASYSAWCHEMQHVYDDRDDGWRGALTIWDKDEHCRREEKAYNIEIKLAEGAGRKDVADKLRANLEAEKERIYGS